MTFSAAYVEIEATYMVPPGSPITSIDQVDRKGVKVVTSARSAYGLWLENNIKNAELIQIAGLDGAFNKFKDDKIDVLAGLRPGLLKDIEKMPGATILPGKFSAVQQAVGCNKPAAEGARYIAEFVENAKKVGSGRQPDREAQGQGIVGRSPSEPLDLVFPLIILYRARNQISQGALNLRCGGRVQDGGEGSRCCLRKPCDRTGLVWGFRK